MGLDALKEVLNWIANQLSIAGARVAQQKEAPAAAGTLFQVPGSDLSPRPIRPPIRRGR